MCGGGQPREDVRKPRPRGGGWGAGVNRRPVDPDGWKKAHGWEKVGEGDGFTVWGTPKKGKGKE